MSACATGRGRRVTLVRSMRCVPGCRRFLVAALFAGAAAAQPQGVPEEWDVRTLAHNLEIQAQHLQPILDQIKPETWVAKGAPDAYVTQWKSSEAELRYLLQSSQAFSRQPDRLPLALDTYFRMQSMNTILGSLIEGIRKYQNPAVGDLVQGIMNENSGNRERLRQYIVDLATEKEQEFQIADKEAQRCRGTLLRQPATRSTGTKGKNQ
jgi:hypothetical protein